MSEQVKAALIRAAIGASVAVLASGQAWVLGQISDREFAAAGLAALSAAVIRVGEGLYDTKRATEHNVKPSDVGT